MKLSDIISNTSTETQEASAPRVVLAYARVSTDDQERAGLSIPAQIREMREYADAKGITIAEIYQEAQSAFSDESRRPEFWRMIERAKRDPSITGILVHDHSRFARDPHVGPMVKGELLAHGVRVVSATEPEYDPRTIAGLAIEKMTEFKNASYSLDVRFHTLKGMRENVARRDAEIGFCYKNGGAAPWGFRAYKVQRGVDRKGAPIMKTLWAKDETNVAGRPVWEWAQHVLLELRLGQRASLDAIRDFLNDRDIPSPWKRYWSIGSLYALLQPSALLQYAGFGVWNVHGPRGRHRPASEWEIVENAHPAIITMEQAEAIMAVNEGQSRLGKDKSKGRMAGVRTRGSRYLLSGGLLVCRRCGANMVGYRNQDRLYYVCGAKAYRRGLGCGEALQVRKEAIEDAVVEEVGHLFDSWGDTKRVMQAMNDELRALEVQESAEEVEVSRELARVDQETENVRRAIRGGLDDVAWANAELRRLNGEREDLLARQARLAPRPAPRRVDQSLVEECRKAFAEVIATGTPAEKRQYVRLFMKRIEVDPDSGEVLMHLFSRPPMVAQTKKPVSTETGFRIGLVAGACFVAMHNALAAALVRRWALPRVGRRTAPMRGRPSRA